jgi:opacity protein-like surface antigen
MKSIVLKVLAVSLAAPVVAMAQATPDDSGWSALQNSAYVGAGVGQSRIGPSQCVPLFDCQTHDTGYKIYTGTRLRDIVGFELGYLNFGDLGRNDGSQRAVAADLSLVLNAPIDKYASVFAKGGGNYGWTYTRSDLPLVATGADRGFDWGFGGGVNINLTQNVALRGEWERHRLPFVGGSQNVDLWTAGIQYKF